MDDFVSYIFDIAQNSIKAKSSYLKLSIKKDKEMLYLELTDRGQGISKKALAKITSPFYTTRTTRNVGLGLPLFVLLCEQTEGSYHIKSRKWIGTKLYFGFNYKHLDFPDEGDYGILIRDIVMNESIKKFIFTYQKDDKSYGFKFIRNKQHIPYKQVIADINNNINRIEENK